MTRLLMVATVAPTIRGFLLPFADHFREQGWRVDAMAHGVEDCPDCGEHFDQMWEINWSRNPLAPNNLLACRRRVQEVVAAQDYDLVHVHTPVAAFVSRFALRRLRRRTGVKVVYTAHGFHFYRGAPAHKNLIYQTCERIAARWTDRLVVMNEEDLAAAKQLRMIPEPHLTFMPGIGVDTKAMRPESITPAERQAARQSIGLDANDRYLLVIAELIARKRHADILRAFAAAQARDTQLLLAGDGPLADDLKGLAKQLKIDDRVKFLGFRNDIPALISEAAAVILASAQEGLPRSIMEAMCLGVPVIGSDIRGTRDLLSDDAGILFELGRVDALADALESAINEPAAMAEIGRVARRKILAYDIDEIIAMHETLYRETLADSRSVK